MATFQERLKTLRLKNGLTQKQAAEIFSVGTRHWQAYEGGTRHPSPKNLHEIADYFGVSLDYLEGRVDEPKETVKEDKIAFRRPLGDWINVPVYDDFMAVCAGRGTATVEGEPVRFASIPTIWLGGSYSTEPGKTPFVVTVQGDSMEEADIPDGAQVLVNPLGEAANGDAVIAEYFGDVMIKWIYWDRDGGGELRSASTKYPPRRFSRDDINNGNFVYLGKVCFAGNKPKKGE